MEKPYCQNKDCKNEAVMIYSGRFMCGECIVKIVEKINKMKQEIIDASL